MSLKLGSRIFSPKVFTTLLTLAMLALLVSLGLWQLRRAEEKRVLFESFAAGADATRRIDLQTPKLRRYQHIEASGHYDESRQVLIDNMVNAERAGYFVITPFALAGGGWVLVNRGWVPLGASRAERPAIPVDGNLREVRGRQARRHCGRRRHIRAVVRPCRLCHREGLPGDGEVAAAGAFHDWCARTITQRSAAISASRVMSHAALQHSARGSDAVAHFENFIFEIAGSDPTRGVWIVGGHYDSRCKDVNDGVHDAPGADDDASGTAVARPITVLGRNFFCWAIRKAACT